MGSSANPFGQQAPTTTATTTFGGMTAQATAPAFGQSSGFGSAASFGGTRQSNPFSTGNSGGSSSTTTTFGSSSGFGGQAGSLSFAPTTATTFGGAAGGSSVGRQFGNNRDDRAPPSTFGNRARNPSFDNSGGGALAFGGGGFNGGVPRQQPPLPPPDAGGDGFGFGGMPSGMSTAFGQPAVRSKKTFPRDPSASVATTFGNASGGFGVSPALSPALSPSTAFGTQSTGVRVRRKVISPAGSAGNVSAGDNPFGSGGGFGSAAGRNASRPPFGGATDVTSHTAFGHPTRVSPGANGATATAFGRGRKEPATGGAAAANSFGENNGTSSDGGGFGGLGAAGALEARLSGGLKKSVGKNKRLQNTPIVNNGNGNSGIEQSGMMPSKKFLPQNTINKSFAGDSDTDSGPFPPEKILAFATSGNNANLRKKNLRASALDFIPTPSASPIGGSSNNNNQDDSSKAELSSAVNLDGTCVDMCSPAERELHIRVDELSVFEKCFPDQPGREGDLIIKRFQRSSADHKLDIPSEVRPPGVLRRTQLYIEQEIMDRERAGVDPRLNPPRVPDIIELYNFCWDRFRMIRKDFVLQNYRGAGGRVHPIALDVHERVARYHILSEHELIEVPSFVAQQNMEQLGQTLKSLNELYDESRNTGDPGYLSPFEAEFRAYFILCALDNGRGLDVLKFVKGLHKSVVDSPQVKFAMKVFVARHTNDYFQFFSLLRQATYLQSCLLFRYIPSIRSGALQRMNRAFRNQPYPLVDLMELLCFDDLEHAGSVCQQHGLDITQPDEDDSDGESIMVQFGGDFETDIQLRKNKKPLEVRSSHVFVGQKQGEYLRKDICRGVTEYYPEEYPPLSHLIQDLETKERARLYPSRPVYEDEYSSFANYSSHASQLQSYSSTQQQQLPSIQPARAAQPAHSAPSAPLGFQTSGTDQQFGAQDSKMLELETIARKKAKLEYEQHMVMQRIEQLQRAKEEKVRLENERKAGVMASLAASPSDETALKVSAEAKAQKEVEDKARSLRLQQKLEDEVRAQEKELQLRKQRELEEMEKRRKEEAAAAAAAEAARQEREAELRRQAKAAEEERKRCEAERLAEEVKRKAAEEIERRRQEQLAEEQARLRREAALEAKRQEQLALERAEKKRQLHIKKQIQARLKLRFHMWMKYVKASKALPPPVKIDASRFVGGMLMTQYKPKSTIQWLFKGETAASQVGTRLRNPNELIKIQNAKAASEAPVPDSSWSSLDVLSLVGPQLRNKHSFDDSPSTINWKLVVGDLVDGQTSSFGVWCASKLGISDNSAPFQVFHSSPRDFNDGDVAVCCRYIGAASLDNFSGQEQQKSTLSGVSALLLSVPLSEVLDTGKCQRWLQRAEKLFARLPKQSQVVVSTLLFANADPSAKTRHTVEVLETSIRQLHTKFAQVVDVSFTLMSRSKNESLADQLAQAIVSLSKRCVPPPKSASIGLKELLEESMNSAMKRCGFSSANKIQEVARSSIQEVYEELRSQQLQPGGYAGFIIPELQNAASKPEVDASDQWQAIESLLATLASQRIENLASQAPLQRDGVCNFFFAKIAEFIDRIFSSASCGSISSKVSTFELKKLVFNLLVPVHDQLANEPASQPIVADAAAARLPWKRIFLEIYGAFFESLGDLSVTVSTTWRSQHTQELLAMESAPMGETRQSSSTQPLGALVTNGFSKAATPPAPAPVVPVVSLNSLKRSFGVALGSSVLSSSSLSSTTITSSSSKQRYEHKTRLSHQAKKEDPRLRRLRQEIAREKAASASFQQLLRREVNRWDLADPASF